jgi:nucleoside-diphosphate-sugar epimerase
MKVLIIGGGGVVGQKLARALAARGRLRGREIATLTLADIVDPAPVPSDGPAVEALRCDIADPASVAETITAETDVIYLLAAIVSGQAESDFDLGYRINMQGVLNVLERCRALGTKPVLVFSSSIAVFGGEPPDPIGDATLLNPQTSYGTQKAIGEMLLNDYSRRGFVDGRGFRLPTISVRPGKANLAASSFMSSIIREPLNGVEAVCPVSDEFEHYYLSPRQCVENLIRGAEVEAEALGLNRCMTMPGRRWSIRQLIDAMTAVAGPEPAKLIRWESQPEVERIVRGWRFDIHAAKAEALGLSADSSFEDNVRYYIEDDRPAG